MGEHKHCPGKTQKIESAKMSYNDDRVLECRRSHNDCIVMPQAVFFENYTEKRYDEKNEIDKDFLLFEKGKPVPEEVKLNFKFKFPKETDDKWRGYYFRADEAGKKLPGNKLRKSEPHVFLMLGLPVEHSALKFDTKNFGSPAQYEDTKKK